MRKLHFLLLGFLGFAMLTSVAQAAERNGLQQATAAADVNVGSSRIDWAARASNDGLTLTVSGPEGFIFQKEFPAGRGASFEVFARDGKQLPDGGYQWEIRVKRRIEPTVQKESSSAEESENGRSVDAEAARSARVDPSSLVQTGHFMIVGGSILGGGLAEPRSPQTPRKESAAPGNPTRPQSPGSAGLPVPQDQVIADDLIVQGSACVGLDCVLNESFGFDTIRLKENNTRIGFNDTSTAAGFPANSWQLTANDSASGGANKFSIDDITGAKTPFTVTAGAATNSIFVDSTGRVGFRTATPVLDLHVMTGNTPALRLDQSTSGGFTAQTWDIAGNEANFFVRDVTGGSRLPFRIRPGAPTSSIDIAASGNVGIGTASPDAKLQIAGQLLHIGTSADSTNDIFAGMGVDLTSGPAFNFGYSGASFGRSSGFFNVRPDPTGAVAPNPSLRFMTGNVQRIIVTNLGMVGVGTSFSAPAEMLHVVGNIRADGNFISSGTTLTVPDFVFEPGYKPMPLNQLAEFVAREKHLPNVPPSCEIQEKGLNLTEFQMRLLEKVEELTLHAIGHQNQIGNLEAENASLRDRLAAIEKSLAAK